MVNMSVSVFSFNSIYNCLRIQTRSERRAIVRLQSVSCLAERDLCSVLHTKVSRHARYIGREIAVLLEQLQLLQSEPAFVSSDTPRPFISCATSPPSVAHSAPYTLWCPFGLLQNYPRQCYCFLSLFFFMPVIKAACDMCRCTFLNSFAFT